KGAIATLLLFLIQGVSFGQVYSYTDISSSDGTYVSAYGSVTGYYNSSTHISSTVVTLHSPSGRSEWGSGGESSSSSLSTDGESGNYYATTAHNGTCPHGNSHTVGGSGAAISITFGFTRTWWVLSAFPSPKGPTWGSYRDECIGYTRTCTNPDPWDLECVPLCSPFIRQEWRYADIGGY